MTIFDSVLVPKLGHRRNGLWKVWEQDTHVRTHTLAESPAHLSLLKQTNVMHRWWHACMLFVSMCVHGGGGHRLTAVLTVCRSLLRVKRMKRWRGQSQRAKKPLSLKETNEEKQRQKWSYGVTDHRVSIYSTLDQLIKHLQKVLTHNRKT